MEHKEFQDLIHLYLYDELDEKQKKTFELHLSSCSECTKEFNSYKSLFNKLKIELNSEVNTQLLQEARSELKGYIRANNKNKQSLLNPFIEKLNALIYKPVGIAFGSVTILFAGLLIGYLLFNSNSTPNNETNNFLSDQLKIQNINFIDSDPSDGQVEFTFDAVKSEHIKGDINNEKLQSLLTYALLNEKNPGTRLNSINVINAKSSSKMDDEIKQTFISVAKFDQNPGVRREALKALSETVIDNDIKDAFIYVLLNDTSSGIRIEAINNLVNASKQGIKFNQNDLALLREKVNLDQNNYVRFQAKNILKEY